MTGMDDYTLYDPDRPEDHRQHDIRCDMGITIKCNTEMDCTHFKMTSDDYSNIVQSLNQKPNELCCHGMHLIQTEEEPVYIVI